MSKTVMQTTESLSPWWGRAVAFVMLLGFSGLILMSVKAYQYAPPIPVRASAPDGVVVFTADDVSAGQAVFLKYGLMNNGTIWGHGAMLGPDFSAQTLRNLALFQAERIAQERFKSPYAGLDGRQKGSVDGEVAAAFKINRHDPASGVLSMAPGAKAAFDAEVAYWTRYLADDSSKNGGLGKLLLTESEMRELTAFFVWTAWASAVQRPDAAYSYTNNFPYEPMVANHPTGATVLWSALSVVALLCGLGVVLLAFGKFDYLGWGGGEHVPSAIAPTAAQAVTPAQAATLKFMLLAALLFLAQTLIGGAVAHYRAEPGDFFGFDLAAWLPSNLLRGWHLQLAIFWVATALVAGALFIASALGGGDPKGQRPLVHTLFWALVVVVVGSLLGQWAGIRNLLGEAWFWLGNQGWEFLEIGRFWQILLAAGLLFWFWLVFRGVRPALANVELRPFVVFFLIAAFAIPFFYLPAFFVGPKTHFAIADVWRFWVIHLWVEGFFEFFVTVLVTIIFLRMGLVRHITALRVIHLDAILYFGGGLMGTAHHWYFTGQTPLAMALGAVFSALEVVPLTLITLDAWEFVRASSGGRGPAAFRHRMTFFFLMAVGFWNFLGAGVFGFLINLPIVSYYEVGTTLTVNHSHAAFVGVFGMLGAGLMAYIAREVTPESLWPRVERCMKISFWGLNIGLAMMVFLSLFPNGVLQLMAVIENGYAYARSLAYTGSSLPKTLEWLRMPGDMVFIVVGVMPLTWGLWLSYRASWQHQPALDLVGDEEEFQEA